MCHICQIAVDKEQNPLFTKNGAYSRQAIIFVHPIGYLEGQEIFRTEKLG